MIDKLRQLGRSSLIYGAGNYGVKLVGFFLIPVYTRYLTPADYGVLALVATFNRILFVFLNLGQSTALFRFYYDHDEPEGRERVIAGSLWIILLISLPVALAVLTLVRPTAQLLLGSSAGVEPRGGRRSFLPLPLLDLLQHRFDAFQLAPADLPGGEQRRERTGEGTAEEVLRQRL